MSNARELAELGGSYGTGGFVGMKNRLINSAMVIDQRNAGASVTQTASTVYTVDRWGIFGSVTSKFSVQRNAGSVTPPTGFTNYLGATSLSSYSVGASEIYIIQQIIEGFNISDLAWGTANAAAVTVSFKVYSSLTGTFGGVITNGGSTRSYPFSFSVPAANTWTTVSIPVAGDTSGTWATDNTAGMKIIFSLGSGTSVSGTAGAWSGSALFSATGATSVVGTNGATFYITGVQLEKGSTATSFDYRPFQTELALAQRYCYQVTSVGGTDGFVRYAVGECVNTVVMDSVIPFPVQMRITPSLTTPAASQFAATASPIAGTAISLLAGSGVNTAGVRLTVASGLTTGRAAQLMSNSNNTSYLLFSSEL
jgi:hypothetical protein